MCRFIGKVSEKTKACFIRGIVIAWGRRYQIVVIDR